MAFTIPRSWFIDTIKIFSGISTERTGSRRLAQNDLRLERSSRATPREAVTLRRQSVHVFSRPRFGEAGGRQRVCVGRHRPALLPSGKRRRTVRVTRLEPEASGLSAVHTTREWTSTLWVARVHRAAVALMNCSEPICGASRDNEGRMRYHNMPRATRGESP
jgi:hypothetical protein